MLPANTFPSVSVVSLFKTRRSVDFPAPERPMIPMNSFLVDSKETLSIATVEPNSFLSFDTCRCMISLSEHINRSAK